MQKPHQIVPQNLIRAIQFSAFFLVASLPFDNALFHFFSLLLLLAFCVSFRWIGMEQVKSTIEYAKWVHVSIAAIWAIMLISNATNAQSDEAWRTMYQFGPRYWLLFAIFSCLLGWRIISEKTLFVASIAALSFHFILFIPDILDLSIFDTRFKGMDRNPNTAGFKAAGLAMLSLYLAFYQNLARRLRYPLVISLGSMALIALLASGNRGSWVAVFVSAAVFLAAMLPKHPKKIIAITISVSFVGVLMLTQFSGPAQRLSLLLDGYSSYRFDIWKNAWNLFLQKPIFGHGLDVRHALLTRERFYHEHNIFISVLTAMGAVGLIAYSAMLASIARLAVKHQSYFPLLLIFMMMVVGMFAYDFYRSQLFVAHFVILAAVATYPRHPVTAL